MTIAAAFRCHDGVVLCTDSEYTGGQSQAKSYGPKIFPVHPRNGVAYMAGSGNTNYLTSIAAQVIEVIGEKDVSPQRIRTEVSTAIKDIFNKDILPLRSTEDTSASTIDILLASQIEGPAQLWRVGETGRASPIPTNLVCSGMESGEAIIKALADILFDSGTTSVYTMPAIARHLIIAAGKHAMYCGGAPQIVCLSDKGDRWEHIYPSNDPGDDPLAHIFFQLPPIINFHATDYAEGLDDLFRMLSEAIKNIETSRRDAPDTELAKEIYRNWVGKY